MFCYPILRSLSARCIVEFGTSYGVSTSYLALAMQENGGGTVFGTERVPSRAARSREPLKEAGLAEDVGILEGDALETLRGVGGPIDFLLNDGFPRF